jgi:hypothetical protein
MSSAYVEINENFKAEIEQEIVRPSIKDDIRSLATWRIRWRRIGNYAETIAKITSGTSTILAFSSGSFDNKTLAFVAGSIGTLSLLLLQYAKYAHSESNERDRQLNAYLQTLGIHELAKLPISDKETAELPVDRKDSIILER